MARSGSMESLFTAFRDALFSADHPADDPAPRAEPDDAKARRRNFVRQVAAAGGAPQSPEATVTTDATAAGAAGTRGVVLDSSGSISPVRPVSLGKSRSRSERRHAKHLDHGDKDANRHVESPQPLHALGRHYSDPITPLEDPTQANFPPMRSARTAGAAGVDARLPPTHFVAPMRRSRSAPGDAEPAAPQRDSRYHAHDQSRHLGHARELRHDIQALRRDYIMGSDAGPFQSGGGDGGGGRGGREHERERARRSREAATLRKSNSDPSMNEGR